MLHHGFRLFLLGSGRPSCWVRMIGPAQPEAVNQDLILFRLDETAEPGGALEYCGDDKVAKAFHHLRRLHSLDHGGVQLSHHGGWHALAQHHARPATGIELGQAQFGDRGHLGQLSQALAAAHQGQGA